MKPAHPVNCIGFIHVRVSSLGELLGQILSNGRKTAGRRTFACNMGTGCRILNQTEADNEQLETKGREKFRRNMRRAVA
jgi:hypothetical protein